MQMNYANTNDAITVGHILNAEHSSNVKTDVFKK